MKKLFFTLVMLLAFNQISNAQGQTCLPTDPDYCTSPCGIVCDIINETDCDLNFVWGYQGGPCSDPKVSGGIVTAGPTSSYVPPLPWHGPCMRFCDQPCECPTMFRVIDQTVSPPVPADPWGGAIFSCCWSGTYHNIFQFPDCDGKLVDVDVTVVNGCITFRFYNP